MNEQLIFSLSIPTSLYCVFNYFIDSFKWLWRFLFCITEDNFPADVKNSLFYPRDTSQPIIATQHVSHAGQVVAIVVAGKNKPVE